MLQVAAQFWNPAYRCFTFNQQDLVPTIDEYTALLNIERAKSDRIYCKALTPPPFKKRLRQILGVTEAWVDCHVIVKGSSECISWASLKEVIINLSDQRKAQDVYALAIYGIIIFPKTIGYVEAAVTDFFSRLYCNINPASTIIAETIRALNFCKRTGTGRFIGCASLLQIWLLSHLCVRKERVRQNFFLKISPLPMALEKECHQNKTEKYWV